MGMRQPARLPLRPAYGLPGVVGADEHDGGGATRGGALALLLLVVLLAAATLWFVARPALGHSSQPQRTCEVIVVDSTTKCVRESALEARATHATKTTTATRAKR